MGGHLTGGVLQAAVIECAHVFGWRVAHFRPARTNRGWRTPVAADGKGFPDLMLVRDRLVAAEIKGDGDRLTPEQRDWIEALTNGGVESYVWRSVDWLGGDIERILR